MLKKAFQYETEIHIYHLLWEIKLVDQFEICGVKYFVFCLQDTQIKDILTTSPTAMTITIMPKFIYDHMIKK